jgi:hypothetical protein
MSDESKRLRDRAANQLRQSRRATNAQAKKVHSARAASLKHMAHNEEWLGGEPEHSKRREPKRH